MLDLHSSHPIIRSGDKTYQGTWQDMTGTEVYVHPVSEGSDSVSCIGKSRQRLVLQSVELRSKHASSGKKAPLTTRLHKLTEQRLAAEAAVTSEMDQS